MRNITTGLLLVITLIGCGDGLLGENDDDKDTGVVETIDLTSPQPIAAGCRDGLKLFQGFNLDGDVVVERRCKYNAKNQLTEGTYLEIDNDLSPSGELELDHRTTLAYDDEGRVSARKYYYSSRNNEGEEYLDSEESYAYAADTGYRKKSIEKDYTESDQSSPSRITTVTYDKLGRTSKTVEEDVDDKTTEEITCEYTGVSFYDYTCTTVKDGKTTSVEVSADKTAETKTLVKEKLVTTESITYLKKQPSYIKEYSGKTYQNDGELFDSTTKICVVSGDTYKCDEVTKDADEKTCYTQTSTETYTGKLKIKLGAESFTIDLYAGGARAYDNIATGGEQTDGANEYTRPAETTNRYYHHADKESDCSYSIETAFDGPGEPETQEEDFDITFQFTNSYDSEGRLVKQTLKEKTAKLESLYDDTDPFDKEWTYR